VNISSDTLTFVVGFLPTQMAFIGHFTAAHDWERLKPTETMWISCEVWDDMATNNKAHFHRGGRIKSVGNLISNKWVDKNTGEERKQFRYRISKILTDSEFYEVTKLLDLDSSEESSLDTASGSGSSWQPTSRQLQQNAVGSDFSSPHTDSTGSRRTSFGNKANSFPVGSSEFQRDSSTPEQNHPQPTKQTFWTPSQRRDNSEPTDYWR
jgi:single-stranded DNA-binding protein